MTQITARGAVGAAWSKVLHRKRLVAILYLISLLLAAVAAAPLAALAASAWGHSLRADRLLSHLDLDLVVEFLHAQTGGISAAGVAVWAGAGLALLVWLVLSGAAIVILDSGDAKATWGRVLGEGGRLFPRFLRLFLVSLVFLIPVFAASGGLRALSGKITDRYLTEELGIALWLVRWAVLLALLFLWDMAFDFARIRTVLDDSRGMIRAAFRGLGFALRNLGVASRVYGSLLLLGILGTLLFRWAANLLLPSGAATLAASILLQQIFIVALVALRLLFWGSEIAVYRSLAPQPQVAFESPPFASPEPSFEPSPSP